MVEFYRSSDRDASRGGAIGFANIVGARLAMYAMSEDAQVLDVEQVRSRLERLRPMRDWFADENVEDGARQVAPETRDAYDDLSLRDAIGLLRERDRQIEFLYSDLADLRAAQPLAHLYGAHPYRSAPATLAPSSPVATSEAAPMHSSASGGWRRVYGALRSRAADVCFALVPVFGGVGVYLICSAGGADTIGAVLGMGVAGLGSVPTLTWWGK